MVVNRSNKDTWLKSCSSSKYQGNNAVVENVYIHNSNDFKISLSIISWILMHAKSGHVYKTWQVKTYPNQAIDSKITGSPYASNVYLLELVIAIQFKM